MENIFTKVCKFCGFVFKYILGKDVEDDEIEKLILESQNLEHFQRQNISNFAHFNETCLCGNVPISSIFVSELECCRKCGRNLVLDTNWKALTVYHATRGTYIGCRLAKRCGKCRLYEHYKFWTEGGLKMLHECFWNKEFLLSTEDTAVDMSVLKYFKHEFVMGATSFQFIIFFMDTIRERASWFVMMVGSNEDEEIDCETENAKGLSKKQKR